MAGFESDYNPGVQGLDVTARPDLQTTQAQNNPQGDRIFQLANALGVAQPQIQQLSQQVNKQEVDKATEYANSMTLDQLHQKIINKELPTYSSPLFQATVEHFWGENQAIQLEQDTRQKIATGQLKDDQGNLISTPQQINAYLTQRRQEILGDNPTQFMQEGVNKTWGSVLNSVQSANSSLQIRQATEKAEMVSATNVEAMFHQVTDPAWKPSDGSEPTDTNRAAAIAQRMELVSKTTAPLLQQQREMALGTLYVAAEAGKTGVVQELLKQNVNGVSVQSLAGEAQARRALQVAQMYERENVQQEINPQLRTFYEQASQGLLDRPAVEAFVNKYGQHLSPEMPETLYRVEEAVNQRTGDAIAKMAAENQAKDDNAKAQQVVDAHLAAGTFSETPSITVRTPTGTTEPFNAKQYAIDTLTTNTANMPINKAVPVWAQNDLENPSWKGALSSGAASFSTVLQSTAGKGPGHLDQTAQQSIQLYRQLSQVDPVYADKVAGDNVKDYRNISFLMDHGFPDVNNAALTVMTAKTAGVTDVREAQMAKDIAANVDTVTNPGGVMAHAWNWVTSIGDHENHTPANTAQIEGTIKDMALLLYKSGAASNAKDAVEAAVRAFSPMTLVANGTVYEKKDLPIAPSGFSQGELLTKFIQKVPGAIATSSGYDTSDVVLRPMGNGNFRAFVGALPISSGSRPVIYNKDQIQKWMNEEAKSEVHQRTQRAQIQQQIRSQGIAEPGAYPNADDAGPPQF